MKKSTLLIIVFVICGLLGVLGQVFADAAKTPLGWTIWDILTAVGLIGFIGGVIYLVVAQKEPKH
ncbi:MAG TPA: hypothetical protein VD794_10215 [Flavisolibacter sp.]|nr:hypothetical protein [Flavisolibacter sp.]